MFHFLHKLVSNFACEVFGAGQVVYSTAGLSELVSWKQLLNTALKRGLTLNHNSTVVGYKTKTVSWTMMKKL